MRSRARAALGLLATLGLLAAFGSCTALPVIERGDCGNGVVETGEDCDTFAPGVGLVCRAPGSIGECRIDCRAASDGSRPACPAGWGCNVDAICRPPASDFTPPLAIEIGGVDQLKAADFDGDGRTDLLASDRPDGLGIARLQLLYFDERGALDDARVFPKRVLAPLVHDVSGDGRSDFVFSTGRVGMILGRADRSVVPETFSSYRIEATDARVFPVATVTILDDSPLVVLSSVDGVPGFYVAQGEQSELLTRGESPLSLEQMAGGGPTLGNVFDDPLVSPCDELVFAGFGDNHFWIADPCTTEPGTERVLWRDQIQLTRVDVDSDNPIDSAPLLVDVNDDGHLDVLVGVSGFAFVSYGDGSTLAPAERYQLDLANVEATEPVDVPMPVAAGDLTADGFVDFVFFNYLLLSRPTPNDPRPTYRNDYGNQGAGWTAAQIVDLNGNGKLDVIAGGSDRLNLDFFNGTGGQYVVPGVVTTSGPVSHIAVGDYDGDLIQDVAFVELARSAGQPDTVKIAYGAAAGPPTAPVAAARVQAINGINTYTEFGISFMIIGSAETDSSGTQDAVITLLETAGDRMPLAPYTLSTFSETGSTQAADALALAAGHFRSSRSSDVLALGTDGPFGSNLALWLAPDILNTSSSPVRLADLPATLQPIAISGASVSVMVAGISADLDGDGRDESLWLMPYRSDTPPPGADVADEQCALLIVRTPAEGELPVLDEPIVLGERCTSPALLASDADGDHHPDLVILTGDAEGQLASKLELPLEIGGGVSPGKKQLSILWNDGQGGFDPADSTLVSAADDSPLAVTTLPPTAQQPFRLAYVTSDAVRLVNASTFPRALAAPTTLAPISGGTSIVAGDLDGDGIVDLAIATAGDVQIVRAGLAP